MGVDVRDLSETGTLVTDAGVEWLPVATNLLEAGADQTVAGAARRAFGSCDILVNNAAIDDPVGWDELDRDLWQRVLTLNLTVPFLLARAVIPLMKSGGWGRIVNIASGAVMNPMGRFVSYRASKMGLIGFSRALASEVGDYGITVNVASPGVTRTAMVEDSLPTGALEAAARSRAIKRVAEPRDIAGTVAFLTSEDCAFVTGQTVLVNGGASFL